MAKLLIPVFPFHLTFQLFRESALLRNGVGSLDTTYALNIRLPIQKKNTRLLVGLSIYIQVKPSWGTYRSWPLRQMGFE